jgi:hypothetical protein
MQVAKICDTDKLDAILVWHNDTFYSLLLLLLLLLPFGIPFCWVG